MTYVVNFGGRVLVMCMVLVKMGMGRLTMCIVDHIQQNMMLIKKRLIAIKKVKLIWDTAGDFII